MRILTAALLAAIAFPVAAQSGARPLPPGSVPLAEPPPPPELREDTKAPEPQVTVRHEGEEEIQEYRINGKLYMQRVTPKHGKPYILMDQKGDGTFTKQDNTIDPHVRVPQWVLVEF
ncbi:MAG TPA: DUF2782 domain-containing protein [Usitatibacter sp.]|nr:DUF2782 domain-containing protein [Usitatibacter sp.]